MTRYWSRKVLTHKSHAIGHYLVGYTQSWDKDGGEIGKISKKYIPIDRAMEII